MTEKEAIKELRHLSFVLSKAEPDNHIHSFSRWFSIELSFSEELLIHIKTAIEALEKQIPKKPYEPIDTYSYCPVCNSVLAGTYYKAKFCHKCGQRIDWSESEES